MLSLEKITKEYDQENKSLMAVKDVDFSVEQGEFTTLIGPSGCGKSTLLRIIASLEKPNSGYIKWSESPKIGFVFQNFALFPYLSVLENIQFGLKMLDVDQKQSKKIALELVEEFGLRGFEEKHPKELSGGMKQRVGIARALAIEPNVLLLDEPFSSLDEFTAETLRKLLLEVWKKRKVTIIMVTHLVSEAIELSDKIIVFTPRPGTVEDTVENKLSRPRDLRSKGFFDMEDKLIELVKA